MTTMILNAIFMPTMCIIDNFNGLLLFEFKTEKEFYCFDIFFYNYLIVLPSMTSTLFFWGGYTMSYLKKKIKYHVQEKVNLCYL